MAETTHVQIVEKFQEMKNQAAQISNKLHDLSADSAVRSFTISEC